MGKHIIENTSNRRNRKTEKHSTRVYIERYSGPHFAVMSTMNIPIHAETWLTKDFIITRAIIIGIHGKLKWY